MTGLMPQSLIPIPRIVVRSFGDPSQIIFEIDPVHSDQAKYLMAYYSLSISHPKP
jgi:hypothetical protein